MTLEEASHSSNASRWTQAAIVSAFLLVLLGAAFLRLRGVAVRSLWLDEFCTWHVARLPMLESLRWGPELTIPPLYQFILRLISADPHAPEELLRMPAVVAGVLTVAGSGWLGWMLAGRSTGLALALLLAFNVPQIEYSREARPYSLLVLLSVLSTACWLRLVTRPHRRTVWPYVVAASASVHAHYLAILVIAAQAVWWLGRLYGRRGDQYRWRPGWAMVATLVLCAPVLLRPLVYHDSISQALVWLEPGGMGQRFRTLGQVTYGIPWVVAGLVPAIIILIFQSTPSTLRKRWQRGSRSPDTGGQAMKQSAQGSTGAAPPDGVTDEPAGARTPRPEASKNVGRGRTSSPLLHGRGSEGGCGSVEPGPASTNSADEPRGFRRRLEDLASGCGLLLLWLLYSWLGLLALSLFAGPVDVVRYALPAAVPALLLPLVVARAVHRVLPLVIAGLVVGLTSPRWIEYGAEVEPGFRELTKYVRENLDPAQDAVVLVRDTASFPDWPEMERLALAYYPIEGWEVTELDARPEAALATGGILHDPRALYLIVFRAEVEPLVYAAGRRFTRVHVDGESFSSLLFAPYRLLRVAPLSEGNGAA